MAQFALRRPVRRPESIVDLRDVRAVHVCTDRTLEGEAARTAIRAAIDERRDNLRIPPSEPPATKLMAKAAAAVPQPINYKMAVPVTKLWKPGSTLKVRLLSRPAEHVADRIRHYAAAWSEHANVGFRFVTRGSAQIRISFDEDSGSWSYLGTDAKVVASSKATMNYGWLDDETPEDEFSRVVLHEFGHALGAIHEHNHPASGIRWNRPAVYEYYRRTQGWTKADVDAQIFRVYEEDQLNAGTYDRASIMHYAIPRELLLDGAKPVPWNRKLSSRDKAFIRTQYPG